MTRIVIEEPCVDRDRFGCCEDGWHRRVLDLVEIDRDQGIIHYIDRTLYPRVMLWIDGSILSEQIEGRWK